MALDPDGLSSSRKTKNLEKPDPGRIEQRSEERNESNQATTATSKTTQTPAATATTTSTTPTLTFEFPFISFQAQSSELSELERA